MYIKMSAYPKEDYVAVKFLEKELNTDVDIDSDILDILLTSDASLKDKFALLIASGFDINMALKYITLLYDNEEIGYTITINFIDELVITDEMLDDVNDELDFVESRNIESFLIKSMRYSLKLREILISAFLSIDTNNIVIERKSKVIVLASFPFIGVNPILIRDFNKLAIVSRLEIWPFVVKYIEDNNIVHFLNKNHNNFYKDVAEEYGLAKSDDEYVKDYLLHFHNPTSEKETERYALKMLKIEFPFRNHEEFNNKILILRGKAQGMVVFRPLTRTYKKAALLNKTSGISGTVGKIDETFISIDDRISEKNSIAFGNLKKFGIYGCDLLYNMWHAQEAPVAPWTFDSDNRVNLSDNLLEDTKNMIEEDISNGKKAPMAEELLDYIRSRLVVNFNRQDINENWLNVYNKFSTSKKAIIQEIFKLYLNFAFYTRGWRGNPSVLPLKLEDTNPYNKNENAELATNHLFILNERLDSLNPEISRMLRDAPLYRSFGELGVQKQANTIGEDIEKLMKNEGYHSCIRMSSFALMYTAHYYLTLMNAENWMRFDPKDLIYIS